MRPLKVLIADRDNLLLSAYRTYLVAEPVDLTTVTSAAGLQEALQRQWPDVLILDPDTTGARTKTLLGQLNQSDGTGRRPVVIVTARPQSVSDDLLAGHGESLFLKPVSPALIARLVGVCAESMQDAAASIES
jgi:DNA-binding response OmpR family regulator